MVTKAEKVRRMKSKAILEERMARIEGVLEQMDKRLTDFRGDFNTRLNHIESRLNWTLGTIITM